MVDNFPLRLLLATFGGWLNQHQTQAIEYLAEENRVLKEQLGASNLALGPNQRESRKALLEALNLTQAQLDSWRRSKVLKCELDALNYHILSAEMMSTKRGLRETHTQFGGRMLRKHRRSVGPGPGAFPSIEIE